MDVKSASTSHGRAARSGFSEFEATLAVLRRREPTPDREASARTSMVLGFCMFVQERFVRKVRAVGERVAPPQVPWTRDSDTPALFAERFYDSGNVVQPCFSVKVSLNLPVPTTTIRTLSI